MKGEEGRRRGEGRGARRVERRGEGRWGGERREEVQQRPTPWLPLGCLSVASRLSLGCHFHLITARSPSKGLSSAFSPSSAPDNIISLPPTSVDMLASEAVMPRMRCGVEGGGVRAASGRARAGGRGRGRGGAGRAAATGGRRLCQRGSLGPVARWGSAGGGGGGCSEASPACRAASHTARAAAACSCTAVGSQLCSTPSSESCAIWRDDLSP